MERPEYYGNPAGITDEVDVVRAIYDAFADRDIERALVYIDPDCEIVLEGTMTAAGRSEPYQGHDGMRQYFADVMRVWEELELHATDFRVVPGSVVVMGHVVGRLGGQDAPVRRAVVWTWRLRDARAVFMRASDMGELRG
jgi:ketosteroid isomerase-like protein